VQIETSKKDSQSFAGEEGHIFYFEDKEREMKFSWKVYQFYFKFMIKGNGIFFTNDIKHTSASVTRESH
jgi:hypothetical protein